jgi:CheY-like chemotaxis protein
MKRILVIDDNQEILDIISKVLSKAGYAVSSTTKGEDGARLFRQEPFDLIITDIIMPEKGGIDLIIDLKNEFSDVKIIAISGGGINEPGKYLDLAYALGATITLSKPFSNKDLLAKVSEALTI